MVNYFHPKLSFRNRTKRIQDKCRSTRTLHAYLSSGGFNVTTNAAQSNHYILNEFQYKYMRLFQREQIAFLLIYHLLSGYFTRIRRVGTKMCKYLG